MGTIGYSKGPGSSTGSAYLAGDTLIIAIADVTVTTTHAGAANNIVTIRRIAPSTSSVINMVYHPASGYTLAGNAGATLTNQSYTTTIIPPSMLLVTVTASFVTIDTSQISGFALVPGVNTFEITVNGLTTGNPPAPTSASKTISVTASDYTAPTVDSITAVRCTSNGTESVLGTYLKMKATWTPAKVNGASITTTATYTWGYYGGPANPSIPITAQNTFMPLVGGSLSPTTAYFVTVTLTNATGPAVSRVENIPTMTPAFYFKKGGRGMGIGVEPTVTDQLHIAWPIYASNEAIMRGNAVNLRANSYIRFQSSGGTDVGYVDINYRNLNIYGTVQSNGVTLTSKEDIKEDIELAPAALDIIKGAEIFTYNLKDEKKRKNRKRHYGLVIGKGRKTPDAVITDAGDSIDLYSMVSLCWKAVQELAAKCDHYGQRIEDLERRLADADNDKD